VIASNCFKLLEISNKKSVKRAIHLLSSKNAIQKFFRRKAFVKISKSETVGEEMNCP